MGIESPTMLNRDGEVFPEIYEMPNGCLCCSSKSDLFRLIEYFCEKKPEIEYLLIEANGLADVADVSAPANARPSTVSGPTTRSSSRPNWRRSCAWWTRATSGETRASRSC